MNFRLLILLYLIRWICCTEENGNILRGYLEGSIKNIRQQFDQISENTKEYSVKLNESSECIIQDEFIDVVSMGDRFIIDGNDRVYDIENKNNYQLEVDENFHFFRKVEFQTNTFLLYSSENVSYIYEKRNSNFSDIQKIRGNVNDADFFTSNDSLFLILTKNGTSVYSTLYKHVNGYFDEIHSYETEKLNIIENNGTHFAFNICGKEVVVYEFRHENFEIIQKINGFSAVRNVFGLSTNNTFFAYFYNEQNDFLAYMWTGLKFTFWSKFSIDQQLEKMQVFDKFPATFLLASTQDKFFLYNLTNGKMDLIESFENENPTTWYFSTVENSIFSLADDQNCTRIKEIRVEMITHKPGGKSTSDKTKLMDCILNVERNLYKIRNRFDTPANISEDVVLLQKRQSGSGIRESIIEITRKNQKVKSLMDQFTSSNNKPKTLVVNETVSLKNFDFKTIKTRDLRFKTAGKDASKLHVKNLTVSRGMDDLFVLNGKMRMNGQISTKHLDVNNLRINSINNISMSEIYLKSRNETIEGLKEFSSLSSRQATFKVFNGHDSNVIASTFQQKSDVFKYLFNNNLTVDHLWLTNVNDVNFEDFKNSVVRLGHDNSIEGNLTFVNVTIAKGKFNTIAGRKNLLTSPMEQIVKSNITIDSIFTRNISGDRINGIDFKNVKVSKDDRILSGPVKIDNVEVENNLIMEGETNELFLTSDDRHIIGTKKSDLLQFYNSKVIIQGDLYVDHLQMDSINRITIKNNTAPNIFTDYWSKSRRQTIPRFFEAKNKIITPHLFAKSLNGHDIGKLVLISDRHVNNGRFYFDQIRINGSVFLDENQSVEPNLRKIDEESVKTSGSFKVVGLKNYSSILKINEIQSPNLGDIEGLNFAREDFEDVKSISIKGNLQAKLSAGVINGINIKELVSNACYIDADQTVDKLVLKNITVTNLKSPALDELIKTAELSKQLDSIPNIKIYGDVKIKHLQAATLNNRTIEELLRLKVVSKNNVHEIFGDVNFAGTTSTKDFSVMVVNGVYLPKLTKRLLYKKWPQTLTGNCSIINMKSDNLITDFVNDIPIQLIDKTSSEVQNIRSNIRIKGAATAENIDGNLDMNLLDSLKFMQKHLPTSWDTVRIKGNVTFWEEDSTVYRIFEKTLSNESTVEIITGSVSFNGIVFVKNLTTSTINGVNLTELINDAVLNDEQEVTVTGSKIFPKIVANQVIAYENLESGSVNNINISEIDEKIISRHDIDQQVPIKGLKIFFEGLQINTLQTEKLGNTTPDSLVIFNQSPISNKVLAHTVFESIDVKNDLTVKTVNNMDLDNLIKERVKLNSTDDEVLKGTYYIRGFQAENIFTNVVNDIQFENVVIDEGVQIIESPKAFNDISVDGNIQITYLNKLLLSETYEQAVLTSDSPTFHDITVSSPAVINGNIIANFVNGFPMNYNTLESMLYTPTYKRDNEEIHKITDKITSFISSTLDKSLRMPREMSYLENSTNLQIFLPNTNHAEVSNTNDGGVLLHVTSEESGAVCKLPETCTCLTQRTIQISPRNSFTDIVNKATQRIFSHIGDSISIHVVTNTISTNSYCRTNGTFDAEISYITWNIIHNRTDTDAFYMHQTFITGYISDVKFFTVGGNTYIVIGRYYDPSLDTHNLDCAVLKFTEDLKQLKQIQTIDSFAVWSLSLIYTAQGVVLVAGSKPPEGSPIAKTGIFKFNQDKDQFDLLREASVESILCVGVVFEEDSLIILADRYSTLQVLKYQESYDNYDFYQTIQMDFPIRALSVIYSGEYGISTPYLTVVTRNKYFMYSYQFIEGWRLESSGRMDKLNGLIPFKHDKKIKLFAPSSSMSTLLTVAEYNSP